MTAAAVVFRLASTAPDLLLSATVTAVMFQFETVTVTGVKTRLPMALARTSTVVTMAAGPMLTVLDSDEDSAVVA